MIRSGFRYHVLRLAQRYVVNPPVRLIWALGFAPPGDAQLETIGRRTGKIHRTRICNGQVGDTVWLVAQHGRRTDYVRNIEADPRVRFRTGPHRSWHDGVAHVLDDDDPRARRRLLAQGDSWRRLCQDATRAMSTDPLTVRIDLAPPAPDAGPDRRRSSAGSR